MSGAPTGPITTTRPGSVSSSSAQRFAARVRDRRRRRTATLAAVLVAVLALGWLVLFSPWAKVRTVQIRQEKVTSAPGLVFDRVSEAQLRLQAEEELGRPMLLARVAQVQTRVARLRLVESVQVRRAWPGTLVLTVRSRQPVAAVPYRGKLAMVDRDGVRLGVVEEAPAGLPRVDVDLGRAGAAGLQACLEVVRDLPAPVARRVRSIGAESPDGIVLTLRDGATVAWGDASEIARKAEVLLALLPQKAAGYDVRSPGTPAVRPR